MINLNANCGRSKSIWRRARMRQSRVRKAGLQEMVDVYAETDDASLPVGVFIGIPSPSGWCRSSRRFSNGGFQWARQGADMSRLDAAQPDVVLQIMADRALSLPLKYSGAIQAERARQRFGESRIIVVELTATNGWRASNVYWNCRRSRARTGICRLFDGNRQPGCKCGCRCRHCAPARAGAAMDGAGRCRAGVGDNDICLPLVDRS
jgi:hypothetical protein